MVQMDFKKEQELWEVDDPSLPISRFSLWIKYIKVFVGALAALCLFYVSLTQYVLVATHKRYLNESTMSATEIKKRIAPEACSVFTTKEGDLISLEDLENIEIDLCP